MGIDRPDDPDGPDGPPDGHADHRDDQGGDGRAGRSGGVQSETRLRQEYYSDLRAAVSAEESVAAQRTVATEQAMAEKWDETTKESRWMWSEYQQKWPKDQGFELDKLKNFWPGEQYKGINSQWIEPDTGQRFEVQFHTRISFEAKQLTHGAYERLRTQQPDEFEKMVLKAFQQRVSAEIPVPSGAADIPDYSERDADAR